MARHGGFRDFFNVDDTRRPFGSNPGLRRRDTRIANIMRLPQFREFAQGQLTGGLDDLIGEVRTGHQDRDERLMDFINPRIRNINERQRRLTGDITGGFQGRADEALAFLNERTGNLEGRFAERTQQGTDFFDALSGKLGDEFKGLRERSLADLEGSGEQARADIRRRFREDESRRNNDLVRRGLRASTAGFGANARSRLDEEAEFRRLGEGLRRERIGIDRDITGDRISLLERLGGARSSLGAALSGQELGASERLATQGLNTRTNLAGDTLQAAERLGSNELATSERLNTQSLGLQERVSGEQLRSIQQLLISRLGLDANFFQQIGGDLQRLLPLIDEMELNKFNAPESGRPISRFPR